MPGMTMREFECALCQKGFLMMGADFYIPQPDLCEACLMKVWALDGEALKNYINSTLAGPDGFTASQVIDYIQNKKSGFASAEQLIQYRLNPFGSYK